VRSAFCGSSFVKDYISGEFDFTVEAGSTAPKNEAFRRDMALQIVSAMQPFAQAGLVNLPKLAEYVLRTGFGVKDAEKYLSQPEPQAPEGMPMSPDQAALAQQGMPPGMTPDQMVAEQQGLGPEMLTGPGGQPPLPPASGGLESLPPEVLLQLLQGMQQ
jgi:hypothetical protein